MNRPAHLDMPHRERVSHLGHRAYIGAPNAELWYGIGILQYQFLISQGLQAQHKFVDIACGSLRLGQYLIPFLDSGNYFGLEAEPELVEQGLKAELRFGLAESKMPAFSFGYDFDFSFVETFDYAIAQSLFTHLVPADIEKCLTNLRPKSHELSRFYFTFFEGDSAKNPEGGSDAHLCWFYSADQMSEMLSRTGWKFNYVGEWDHPRGQMIAYATV